MDITTVANVLLLGFLLPLWLVLGFADWSCHRKADIAHTAGWRESFMHMLLVGQAGIAALAGMFFQVNALILALMIAMFLAHEITTSLDISFAASKRYISPTEQRVHDYLTAIPLAVLIMVCAIHPAQFAALFGFGSETADFFAALEREPAADLVPGRVATAEPDQCAALYGRAVARLESGT